MGLCYATLFKFLESFHFVVSTEEKSETKGIICLYSKSHFRLLLFISFYVSYFVRLVSVLSRFSLSYIRLWSLCFWSLPLVIVCLVMRIRFSLIGYWC